MNLRNLLCSVMLSLSFTLVSQASTLKVSVGGTYGSTAPTTMYSTPGGSFTYTFFIDSNPATSNTYSGNFQVTPVGAIYQLNGSSVATSVQVAFFRPYNLTFCLAPTCPRTPDNYISIDLVSRSHMPLYSGVETSPTISTGTFTVADGASSYGVLAGLPTLSIVAVSSTPEPSSLLLMGTGVAAVCAMARRRLL